jgi:ABC-type Zn uptake system ZnuABC Zn-binding protein ZnuA
MKISRLVIRFLSIMLGLLIFVAGCSGSSSAPASSATTSQTSSGGPAVNTQTVGKAKTVLVAETFLADITRNVAGDRLTVNALMPIGTDPHAFEAAPADAGTISACDLLIINGAGFEEPIAKLLTEKINKGQVIEASAGLASRVAKAGESVEQNAHSSDNAVHAGAHDGEAGDPHFWLDPTKVIRYVENIRDGLSRLDPAGATFYQANAQAYITKLRELDRDIEGQVAQIPPERRLLVTNHESLGYFADRYGFKVIGTVIPSAGTDASPSAQQLTHLVEIIRTTGAKAIFLETGASPQLAQQIAKETGIKAIAQLYTHSITEASEVAPTYIDMMKYNTKTIVDALK